LELDDFPTFGFIRKFLLMITVVLNKQWMGQMQKDSGKMELKKFLPCSH
jgi:hypothetical protein